MIDLKRDFLIINNESIRVHQGKGQRDKINDPAYLCIKLSRHLLQIALGKTHDPASGVHEMSKVLWYIRELCHIYKIKIKL